MLLLLISLSVIGLISSQAIPSYEQSHKRRSENQLKTTLGEVRQAFDLKFFIDPTYLDLATPEELASPAFIAGLLQGLEQDQLLRQKNLLDSTMSADRWNSGTPDTYWKIIHNLTHNPSYESRVAPDPARSEFLASWSYGTPDTTGMVASDTVFFPSLGTPYFDDFPGQNKFGVLFCASGTSLRISR